MKERKMNENLRDKIALHRPSDERSDQGTPMCSCGHDLGLDETWGEHVADAVLAVVGPELERLRAEVERLEAKLRQPCGSCHPCTEWANQTWVNAGKRLPHAHEWDEVLAERDDLRARLAKVEALGDGRWDHSWGCSAHSGGECDCWLSALRAVLASVPEPSDSEPAPAAAAFALKVAEQQMCPNCVTPWKCNGPHIEQPAPDADRRPHSRACGIERHDHGPDCHRNCPTCGGYAIKQQDGAPMTAREPSTVEVIAEALKSFEPSEYEGNEALRQWRAKASSRALAALKAAGFVVATRDEIRAMSPSDLVELIKERDDVTFEWGDLNGSWRFVAHRPIEMP